MVIEGKRILLREWQEEDVDDLVEGLNNLNVSKWLGAVPYPFTKRNAEEFLHYAMHLAGNAGNLMLAIVLKENKKVIGGTSIESIHKRNGTASGGIWLNETYQKNGYGAEAFSLRIQYAFEVLGLRRMENGYFPGNEKSEKMQKRLGYQNEGIRRKKYLCLATGEYVDECITGLLKEEFVPFDPS